MSGTNQVIPVAQCWLLCEKEDDFAWGFIQLKSLLSANAIPPTNVIITDRDLACINELRIAFPCIPVLLCRWHMKMVIVWTDHRGKSFTRSELTHVYMANRSVYARI